MPPSEATIPIRPTPSAEMVSADLKSVITRLEALIRETSVRPLALDAHGVAKLLNMSARTVRRMRTAGELPEPFTIASNKVLWRVTDLELFVQVGGDMAAFNAVKRRK